MYLKTALLDNVSKPDYLDLFNPPLGNLLYPKSSLITKFKTKILILNKVNQLYMPTTIKKNSKLNSNNGYAQRIL